MMIVFICLLAVTAIGFVAGFIVSDIVITTRTVIIPTTVTNTTTVKTK